jgi:isopenicillin N synthase-like dioxygenase
MASSYHFNSYPPFPSDTPTASLTKVSLAKLFSGDVEQSKAMFDCCRTVGFFLLDLSGNEVGEAIVKDLDAMLDITKETMSLSEEEKNEYKADPPKKLLG